MEAESCIRNCLCVLDCATNKEDGHLSHEEAAAHPLEGILGHKAHDCVHVALFVGLQGLQSLDALHQVTFLQPISKPDLSGHFTVVQGQSNTSSSWTVALSDGDVFDKAQDCVTHVVKVRATNALRGIQGKGQLSGVERAFLLT